MRTGEHTAPQAAAHSDPADGPLIPVAPLSRRQHVVLALVLLLALALRGAYLWGQARNNPIFEHPMTDALCHHDWARQIASGQGMGDRPYFRAPLYYYLLAALYWVFGPNVALARFAGCLIGSATCYLLARLGTALGGFRTGLLAGIMAAVYWPLIYFDGELLTAPLEIFWNAALLVALVRAAQRWPRHHDTGAAPAPCRRPQDSAAEGLRSPSQRRGWFPFLAAGVFWGLSAITRPNILAFGPAIVAWYWLIGPRERRLGRTIRATALTAAGAALAILPVTARNYRVGGEWVLIATNGGVNSYIGNNPSADGVAAVLPGARNSPIGIYEDGHRIAEHELGGPLSDGEVSDYWYAKTLAWIRADPGAWGRLMLRKLLIFWAPFELLNNQPIWFFAGFSGVSVLFWIGFPVVAPLAAGGLVLLRRQWRRWFLPAAFLLIYTAAVVAFFCPARYRLPVAPVLILFAAGGLSSLIGRLKKRDVEALAVYLGVCGVCGLFMAAHARDRAAILANDAAEGHKLLGVHYVKAAPQQSEAYEKALSHLRRATELKKKALRPRILLGRVLMRLGRMQAAREQFSKAAAMHADNPEAQWAYGQFLAANGERARAIERYQRAINLQPSFAEAHRDLGCLLVGLGRNAEAIRHLRRSLRIQPNLPGAQACLDRLKTGPT